MVLKCFLHRTITVSVDWNVVVQNFLHDCHCGVRYIGAYVIYTVMRDHIKLIIFSDGRGTTTDPFIFSACSLLKILFSLQIMLRLIIIRQHMPFLQSYSRYQLYSCSIELDASPVAYRFNELS